MSVLKGITIDNTDYDFPNIEQGGNTNDILVKNSNDDYDTKWVSTIPESQVTNLTSDLSSKENISNKVTSISVTSTDTQYPTAKLLYTVQDLKENKSNKTTSISSSSTDTQYPSAKAVYDNFVNKNGNEEISGIKTFTSRPKLVQESATIPNIYQEVEYIQSTGTQYINTGLPVHMNYHYYFDYQKTVADGYRVWGTFNTTTYDGGLNTSLTYSNGDAVRWTVSGDQNQQVKGIFGTTSFDTNRHIVEINNGAVYGDNVYRGTSEGHYASTISLYNAYLFTLNPANTTPTENFVGKIYSYKVWDNNGNAVQNFIPCYRKSDGVIGMYDTINSEFKTNAGSGTFTKGANIVNESNFATMDDIPTKTSDLINDGNGSSAFATELYVNTYGGKIDKIKVNGTEQEITNKAVDLSVPTKTSDLTNDSGFVNKDVNNLTYYTKTSELGANAFTNIILPTTTTANKVLTSTSTSGTTAWTSLSGIAEWDTKQDTLTAGDGIGITNNVISVVNGVYFEEEA